MNGWNDYTGRRAMIDQNLDRPEESGSADVTLVTRGITVTACVEVSSTGVVVVRPSADGPTERDSIQVGDPVELYWVGGQEERTLAGKVAAIDAGAEPRWHLSVTGQAERSQRRKAVRGRVQLPVLIPWAGAQMEGTTVDLSEAGMRALMDGWGVPMEAGTTTQLTLTLDEALIHLQGEIVWTVERGAQWLLAVKFLDVPEKAADLLRRRVFQALRDERAAQAAF
jgi:PilZ domain